MSGNIHFALPRNSINRRDMLQSGGGMTAMALAHLMAGKSDAAIDQALSLLRRTAKAKQPL